MSKTVKIGGIGKSPAIEKINRIQKTEAMHFAGEIVKDKCLVHVMGKGLQNIEKQQDIIDKYHINFKRGIGNGKD